jgi:pyruvate,water dikinase
VVLTAAAADITADDRGSLLGAAAGYIGIGPFAVRSGGIAEDGAEHSYAGIHESVLDVSAYDVWLRILSFEASLRRRKRWT